MSAVDEYMNTILPSIEFAVDRAFASMVDGLEEEIERMAFGRVYSYDASDEATEKRRYKLGNEENLYPWTTPWRLHIRNMTEMREDSGPSETTVVEQGLKAYKQPGPRPFMQEALDMYVDSGRGDMELASAMTSLGFTLT